eukprot:1967597-Pyramimonas_sp.AAC.1
MVAHRGAQREAQEEKGLTGAFSSQRGRTANLRRRYLRSGTTARGHARRSRSTCSSKMQEHST